MAIKIEEAYNSQNLSTSTDSQECVLKYIVHGASSAKEAETEVGAYPIPSEVGFTGRVSLATEPIYFDSANIDNSIFEVTKSVSKTDDEDYRLSMSTTSVNQTIALRGIAAPGSYKFWDNADGAGSPINVKLEKGKMEVQGADILIPVMILDMSYVCSKTEWKALEPIISRKAGMINSDNFKGYQPGELLFSGFQVQKLNAEEYQLSYTFSISPNEDLQAGEFILEAPSGWDAKWTYFGEDIEVTDEDGNIRKEPNILGLYSQGVYLRTQFQSLIPQSARS